MVRSRGASGFRGVTSFAGVAGGVAGDAGGYTGGGSEAGAASNGPEASAALVFPVYPPALLLRCVVLRALLFMINTHRYDIFFSLFHSHFILRSNGWMVRSRGTSGFSVVTSFYWGIAGVAGDAGGYAGDTRAAEASGPLETAPASLPPSLSQNGTSSCHGRAQ